MYFQSSKLNKICFIYKAEKKDAELQNIIAEQKIRTQRILGRLIREGQERGEIASRETFSGNRFVECNKQVHSKTLSEIGITRNDSSTFQKNVELKESLKKKACQCV
jgi:hypothetical protein